MLKKLPASVQNWISVIGLTIALISFLMALALLVLTSFLGHGGVYLGLVIYIILPAVMVCGFALVALGMLLKRRRDRKHGGAKTLEWPRFDLNQKRSRRSFLLFALGLAVFLIISTVGSFEAFHYTESVGFCGTLCHVIMKPEYDAYQHSSHARVSCVECHVGAGADWYVRSKLSGLYQVYATVFKKYPTPIPTPIENLRPARETCEECHWPEKFYTHNLRFDRYYLSDEANTEWDIRIVMKTGGEYQARGLEAGIHWHINPDVKIEYIAGDERREDIPWVRYTDLKTGRVTVFQDEDNPLDPEEIAAHEVRTMDCIDCHNRPSHDYKSPMRFINAALTAGDISKELPEIKRIALELTTAEYAETQEAIAAIERELPSFYEENYPDIFAARKDAIDEAVELLKTRFSENIFPEMKVRWDTHLGNIGRMPSKGCFRCHSSTHVGESGERITQDCNICHVITAQGPAGNLELGSVRDPLEFRHPVDIDEAWKDGACSDCHSEAILF